MRVVIIEDEHSAAENLKFLLSEIDASIIIDQVLDTVSDAVQYFSKENRNIDLAFFDIHLADGNSFDIFKQVNVKVPVIFTTAYDEYAIKAFKVNSIDYLLKPIDESELQEALNKYKFSTENQKLPTEIKEIMQNLGSIAKKYKSSFLVQQRDLLIPLGVEEIAYFTIEESLVKAIKFDNKSFVLNEKLEDIEASLDPDLFFRANRQFIVHRRAILNLAIYFNGKLILNIEPKPKERIIISRLKAPQLKSWIN